MVKYENECCDCAVPAYPCRGSECNLRHVPHYYCDKCNSEFEKWELKDNDGEMICFDCFSETWNELEDIKEAEWN